ncbi:MAG: FGGY-family carbohydrate kinase [Planctomycetaceae bacterium]|jgi:xylulokinase|nr:FGGY-family carbohydrate kinase [Planctomycetaceae bacterium]
MSQAVSQAAVFIGVNLTSDRVNAAAVTQEGLILAESSAPFAHKSAAGPKSVFLEENAEIWWDAVRMALGYLTSQLRKTTVPEQIKAVCVSGDPGILITTDRRGVPSRPAILAEDTRGSDYIKQLNIHGREHCEKQGFRFRPEDPLAKIAWLKENEPKLYEDALFIHQADYIIGHLKGQANVTEFSFAARTGADLLDECWPDWVDYDMYLGVREKLPRLTHLGEKVGTVTDKAAAATGLPAGSSVIMGTATVSAAFLASGARKTGDLHTVLSKHLTISGISPVMIRSPQDLIRVNKLPNRMWSFSVVSQTGTEWINNWFSEGSFAELEHQAEKLLPSTYLAYPNVSKGETFPFTSNNAEGFISPATDNRTVQFASCLQGTALFERFCYQKLDRLAGTAETPGDIYTGGEWSGSDAWMQCRADVTGRVNRRMNGRSSAAFGSAMIAALGSMFQTLEEAAAAMLSEDASFFPNPEKHSQYSELYTNFCALMEEQGYIV